MASIVCLQPAEGNQGGVVPIPAEHASVLSLQAVYTQRTVWPVSLRPIRHSGGLGRLLRMGLAPFLRQSHAKLQSPIPVTQSPSFGVRLTSRSSGPKHQHPHLTFLTSFIIVVSFVCFLFPFPLDIAVLFVPVDGAPPIYRIPSRAVS